MSRVCDLTNVGIQSGHKVSNSNVKTNRKFLPNLRNVALKSEELNLNINLRLAAQTIRTINKYGNIDNFLINFGYNKLSEKGKKLRKAVKDRAIATGNYDKIKVVVIRNRNKKDKNKEEK